MYLKKERIQALRAIVDEAAQCALDFYYNGFETSIKSDDSPVTQADVAISELLEKKLPHIADIPVLSEESCPDNADWQQWPTYWLIDPIDGTKHFINRTGDFCICIAIIHEHRVLFGLIASPTTGEMWIGQHGDDGASPLLEKYTYGKQSEIPEVNGKRSMTHVTLSNTEDLSETMSQLLSSLPEYKSYSRGSALKYIDIVEGVADIYPKMWDTCEWDSAAGQCILECAGGQVVEFSTGIPLSYGMRETLLNPHFISYSQAFENEAQRLIQQYREMS